MKPTDHEMTAIEKVLGYSSFQRGGGMVKRQKKQGESMNMILYCGSYRKDRTRQGNQAYDCLI